MGFSRVPLDKLQQAVDLVTQHRTFAAASRASGIPPKTIEARYKSAISDGIKSDFVRENHAPELLQTIARLRAELELKGQQVDDAVRPKLTVRQDTSPRTSKIRVVCIGDAHDSPDIPDKSRFEWIGAYVRDVKPDVVVQIGDFATLDSLNSHVPDDTLDGRLKPSFENDMGSLNLALQAMQLDGVEKHCTLGNHERRLFLYEQSHPPMAGKLVCSLDDVFTNNGWTYSPYGQVTYYGGVGFVHVPLNRLGKTFGGKNAENTVANELLHDLVFGHSHIERTTRYSKIGPNNYVISCNVGCALPDGHVESYATHSMSGGWSWGIMDMEIQHGHIQGRNWVSMAHLSEKYGRA